VRGWRGRLGRDAREEERKGTRWLPFRCEGGGLWSFQGGGRAFCFLQLPAQTPEGYSAPRPKSKPNQPLARMFTQNSELFLTSRPDLFSPFLLSSLFSLVPVHIACQCPSLVAVVLLLHRFPPPAAADALPLRYAATCLCSQQNTAAMSSTGARVAHLPPCISILESSMEVPAARWPCSWH